MARHRKFTSEFKAQVVLEVLRGAKTAAEVCPAQHQASVAVGLESQLPGQCGQSVPE